MVHLTTALDPASAVPLYEQLYRSLAAEMRAGTLTAGTRMPGKRRLAAELSVSVNTVDTAYQMLAAEGYLTARERSGFTVQEYLALPQGVQPPAAPSAPVAAHPADTAPPVQFDLSTRGVDPGLFPFRTWARLQKELLYSAPELLTPGDARGDAALRQALAEYLAEYRGVQCDPEQLVVGAGLEYLLGLLAPLLPGPAAVEPAGGRGWAVADGPFRQRCGGVLRHPQPPVPHRGHHARRTPGRAAALGSPRPGTAVHH